MKLVGDLVRLNARTLPRAEALVCGNLRLTYPQLNARVNRLASALMAAGVGHGDRVAVLSRNSAEYFCLYFATAKTGAVLVPLNWWNRARQHADVLDDVEPVLFFVESGYAAIGAEAVALASHEPTVVAVPAIGESAPPDGTWSAFMAGATSDSEPEVHVRETDAHMILYTSGTTGQPKGAVLSHRRTMDDAISMAAVLGVRQSDVFVNWSTPFHVGNWDHQKFFLVMGATVVLLSHFEPGEVLAALGREHATVVKAVPVMFDAMMAHPTFATTDLSSLRLLYYGAYDPSGVMRRTADAFGATDGRIQMIHTYGLTEAGCIVTACPADELFAHWGSIGRPIPGVEVRLVLDDGTDAAVGEPGEIWMRGPMMTGYWRRPEASEEALADGWLHTGDVAVSDEDGFLVIVDRKKDMIRSGGQNIYSKEVENCIATHPAVEAVAVIGVPDPVWEESICAVVVLRDDAAGRRGDPAEEEALRDDITRWVRERLAGYNTPRAVVFADSLPANALGKTVKAALRDQYGSMFAVSAHGAGA